jgi:hypothetical protein
MADGAFFRLVKVDSHGPLGLQRLENVLPAFDDKRGIESFESTGHDPQLSVFRLYVLQLLIGVDGH